MAFGTATLLAFDDESPSAPAMPPAVLGVTASAAGHRWEASPQDDRLSAALAQRHGLSEIVARVLAARGVTLDGAEDFLNPTLRSAMPDPSALVDMDRAAARFVEGVERGESLCIFSDYDVDGGTSAALLLRFARALGVQPRLHIPDRLKEGYGPTVPTMQALGADGVRLVVMADCGTTAFAPLEAARDAGIDVIVLDHHAAEPQLPAAAAVVNPNRLDDESGLGTLAACGVTFLFLVAVNRLLRQSGFYTRTGRTEPPLLQWLDLVALGTICDVVPLVGLNRAFAAQGLKVMAQRRNAGLRALADCARLDEAPGAFHAGFVLGPRINAGGRIDRSDLGARLLSTEDPAEALELAQRLHGVNDDRKEVEAQALAEALAQVESDPATAEAGILIVAGETWHPGVIGLVASRLKERYHRPALAIALSGGIGKGSGRSVPGIDLGALVIAARQAGVLSLGGGHRMAAGFTVLEDRLPAFRAFLAERLASALPAGLPQPVLTVDAVLRPAGASVALAEALASLGPYGAGHAEPVVALCDALVVQAARVGSDHVRLLVRGDEGGAAVKAMGFRCADSALGELLLSSVGRRLHIAGTLRREEWQGRVSAMLTIRDAARA